jgi:hypothetical protein
LRGDAEKSHERSNEKNRRQLVDDHAERYRGNSYAPHPAAQRTGLQLRQPALTGLAEATGVRRQKATRPGNAQLAGVSCKPLLGGGSTGWPR